MKNLYLGTFFLFGIIMGAAAQTANFMPMVYVGPGAFTMGSPAGEARRENDELQHEVTISQGFYLGVTEVTQAQYKAVMGTNPSDFKGDTLPVERVNWFDAVAFCNALSKKEGKTLAYTVSGTKVTLNADATGYRLPTEAQWEYAARGGPRQIQTPFPGSANVDEVAWYAKNSDFKTHAVGTKKANDLGLFDMSGNVLEWCWDLYGYYQSGRQTDPMGAASGNPWVIGDVRVLRGGTWDGNPWGVRAASRYYARNHVDSTGHSYSDLTGDRDNQTGFRVLCPQIK